MNAVRTVHARAIKCVVIAMAAAVLAAVGAVGMAGTASAAPSGGDGGIFVQDGADVLSADTEDYVRRSNEKWEKDNKLPVQLLVVTADKTPDGKSIEDWSMSLAEKYKPGDEEKDTGLVYAVAVDDHKDRLEVGYGLEDKIPDAMASQMIREAEAHYKEGDYDAGVRALVEAVGDQLYGDGWTPSEDYVSDEEMEKRQALAGMAFMLIGTIVVIGLSVIMEIIDPRSSSARSGYKRHYYSSSGSGYRSSSHSSFGGGGFGGGGASGSW